VCVLPLSTRAVIDVPFTSPLSLIKSMFLLSPIACKEILTSSLFCCRCLKQELANILQFIFLFDFNTFRPCLFFSWVCFYGVDIFRVALVAWSPWGMTSVTLLFFLGRLGTLFFLNCAVLAMFGWV
jgi:hypothetical protein